MRTTSSHLQGQLFLMSFYFTVLHTIPAPVNFTILSHNFKHILQWSPGINSPPETLFSVNYSCNSTPQPLVRNITNTTVDVSETLKNIFRRCTFLLWASIDSMTSSIVSKSITPYEDTIIGPPIILLSGCGHCLNISISLPNESRQGSRLQNFYNSVSFKISWKKAGQNEASYIFTSSRQYVLQKLQAGNQYCVKVLPKVSSNLNTQPSAWQCEYTSTKNPEESYNSVSQILGVTVPCVVVLLLVLSLVYTGLICKPRIPLPKTLGNIPKAYYLIPEQTLFESVSQLISASKNHPTKNNNPLNAEGDPEGKPNEDEENYINKADTEDEDEEEDEHNCNYTDCGTDSNGWETNGEKAAIVPSLTLHNNSGIFQRKGVAMDQIRHDTFLLDMSEDRGRHNSESESKGNQHGAADVCNINLCSVTLRGLGPGDDLDEEEVCKPLLPKLVESKVEELLISDIDLQERPDRNQQICTPILEEMKTDDPMAVESQDLRLLCSSDLDMRTEHDTGYMATHTGNIHEQNRSLSEETDCDTDYLSR